MRATTRYKRVGEDTGLAEEEVEEGSGKTVDAEEKDVVDSGGLTPSWPCDHSPLAPRANASPFLSWNTGSTHATTSPSNVFRSSQSCRMAYEIRQKITVVGGEHRPPPGTFADCVLS